MVISPSISLCMIVKDEADCIDRCLQSVKEVVDEIIVVDTGSIDETVTICKRHNAIVIHHTWEDDFAKARNIGIQKAKGDWILWLDADEEWHGNVENIKAILQTTTASVLSLPVVNFHGESEPVDYDQAFILYQYRLFHHNEDITFTDRIHERLLLRDHHTIECVKDSSITVHHYGYLKEYVYNKQKSERNITLIVQEMEKGNNSPWLRYHLASEYASLKQYYQAFECINAAIIRFIEAEKKPPSILYRLKYGILVETDNIEGAWPAIDKALILYPDYVDLHYYKGYLLNRLGQYEESLKVFERCLELGENHESHLVFKGTGSFRAWEQIGLCLQALGDKSGAAEAFNNAKKR